jgi:cytosine/adenosine deaminase-related metal-dependent hydrolase
MSEQILIKGGHVVPGDGAPELPRSDVLVDGGVIAAVGPDLPAGGAEVIDATGLVVLPGLVDGHRHVWQAPLRGVGADLTLPGYFEVILGRALPAYRPEDARLASLLGAAEALDAGITTVFDWSNAALSPAHTDAVLDGLASAGIRAVVAHARPDDTDDARRVAGLRGTITGALAILGPGRSPWDDAVRQLRFGRELGVVVSMHANGGGAPDGPVRRMHEAGLLGPRVQLVHLNAATDDEVKLLVDAGVGVTVTPLVEALMGHGAAPYGRFTDAGGRVGLGADVVVNAPADLFESMRDVLRAERLRFAGPGTRAMPPAASVLGAATIDSARAIGLADRVGSIAPGKRADLILVDGLAHLSRGLADPATPIGPAPATGAGSIAGAVVTCAGPADVHTVIVDGRIVKRAGRLVEHDLAELRAAATELARRVLAG